jgi:hypothetical protein
MEKKLTVGPNDMFVSFGPCSVQLAPVSSLEGGGDGGEGMGTVAGGSGERKVGGRWQCGRHQWWWWWEVMSWQ